MKWVMKDPVPGDMIRVESGTIYHFGIYVSDDEVIQFGLAPSQRVRLHDSEVEVLASDINGFLAGGFLEVAEFDKKEKKKHRSAPDVIAYARSKIGSRGYSIIYNNCEHFANECLSGDRISRQAEDVRALFRNMPVVDVYLAEIPERCPDDDIACLIRREEIENTSNERVKREKYYVWKLLGYALERSFGLKINNLTFTKEESGRYVCDKAEFSLSHSKNALAVAVSRKAVGVDIEESGLCTGEGMAERIMTPCEYKIHSELSENEKQSNIIKLWTVKEALFKEAHRDSFVPSDYDTSEGKYSSFEKLVGGKNYVVSVATENPERIRIYENIVL